MNTLTTKYCSKPQETTLKSTSCDNDDYALYSLWDNLGIRILNYIGGDYDFRGPPFIIQVTDNSGQWFDIVDVWKASELETCKGITTYINTQVDIEHAAIQDKYLLLNRY